MLTGRNVAQMTSNFYEDNLDRTPANYEPLSPLSFLKRTAEVYPNHIAIVHGESRTNYGDMYSRCRQLASALTARGIGQGDTVAVVAPNVPATLEAHFGVPMAGAVLNAINTRLDAKTIAFILEHGDAKALITDRELSPIVKEALSQTKADPFVIDIDDPYARGGDLLGDIEYEDFLDTGDPTFAWTPPSDEWNAISLNYTSGTTGNPKGVVYHHRGAYLLAIGNNMAWGMGHHPTYLWTLPMFHCNGWCFPWGITAVAGTHVCLRKVEAGALFEAMRTIAVTHFCGAPTVLNMLVNATDDQKANVSGGIRAMTAGAAPPAAVIAGLEKMGFDVTHTYGLTEVYGPAVVCSWHAEWDEESPSDRAVLKARQGVRYHVLEGLKVMDPQTMVEVPADGRTLGEVMFRGNVVMKGYLKNPDATEAALKAGWFHSGDLAVCHEDGYIELKDRAKDIIISGGENISTIEVESVLYQHSAVLEAAVVARPDEKWGETPCAFVTLKPGFAVKEAEIIAFCRDNMAHFKAPKTVIFGDLPKTLTGKIQKFVLRDRVRML